MIKKLGLVLHCLVSPPSRSWSMDVCGFAQAKRTCRAPSARRVSREAGKMCLDRDLTKLTVQSCSQRDAWRAAAAVDLCDGVLKNCGFGDP